MSEADVDDADAARRCATCRSAIGSARDGDDERARARRSARRRPSPPVDDALLRQSLIARVRAALAELDDKEREVVELRFGLDRDGEMRTLQEIGEALHLSRERIRQIEARAKEKLRRSKRASELRSYLN